MPKEGLNALADSYGHERNELHQLKVFAESFFDRLREELLGFTGHSIRMVDLTQTTSSFSEFSTDEVAARHLMFLGSADQIIAVMRLDDDLARALIDSMLGAATPKTSAPDRKMTAVEERVIANTLGVAIVRTAQRVLAPMLHDSGNLRLVRIEHRPVVVADTFAPSEAMVNARVRCDPSARGGWIELGLPFSLIYKIRANLVPARPKTTAAAGGEHKARTFLADASMELSAVLGCLTMPLSGVRTLRPGSVLMLQRAQRGLPTIELRAGDQALFNGSIVEHDGWYRFLIDKTGGTDERSDSDCRDAGSGRD
jgi:flagellar motor switch protein FliM